MQSLRKSRSLAQGQLSAEAALCHEGGATVTIVGRFSSADQLVNDLDPQLYHFRSTESVALC